jgi:uncharacterized protein (TIGR00730 family)
MLADMERKVTDGPTRSTRGRRNNVLTDVLPRLDGAQRDEQLVREMVETSLKLLRDGTSLGDIKILNASLRELRYAFKVFAPYRAVRKVSLFGSARTPPTAPATRAAHDFAKRIADAGYMLITGAGHGIMRAGQEGAGRERSFGVNIRLPFEQEPNEFRYFFTRKLLFIKEADAAVLFPGGFGTHDEAYECLTLVQTGKTRPMPIVFLDSPRGTYWKTWKRYVEEHLLRHKLISEEDMSLFKVTTSIDEAVAEITGFHRVYHSSRTVGRRFVMRLNRKLSDATVAALAKDFADIISAGAMEQAGPLEGEEEPEIQSLPRLVFQFNRTHFGRLRQLIDRVNLEG